MPVGVEFDFVDQCRADHTYPPDLNVVSRTIAQVRIYWKSSCSAECRKRIIDRYVVVDIPEIKTLFIVGVFIHANDIFANVQGVGEVECEVAGRGRSGY